MQLVNKTYVCEKLLISESTLRRMAARGEITKHKISLNCVRYNKDEVRRIIENRCGNECGNEKEAVN